MKIRNIHVNAKLSNGDETIMEGSGYNSLFHMECLVQFENEKLQIDEVETYIDQCVNHLEKDMIDKILKLSCEWKNKQISDYPDMEYAQGLSKATEEDILKYIHLDSITVYRNPYNPTDKQFGASLYCYPDWDKENHMEIILKGKEVLAVREFWGYGEFAIWKDN